MPLEKELYTPPRSETWSGRIDDPSDPEARRWHEVIRPWDLLSGERPDRHATRAFCLLGFRSDLGVQRNLGRAGAAEGPDHIRRQLANLPCVFGGDAAILDGGDIVPTGGGLEAAQDALADAVQRIVAGGALPVVLGGGHELALGHALGLEQALAKQRGRPVSLGIVNFDAHLDLRPPDPAGSSGTMFAELALERRSRGLPPFPYLCVGAQLSSNTISLFRRAEELGGEYLLARDIAEGGFAAAQQRIETFCADRESLYVTVCADVFSSAFAPGVSSPQPLGLAPDALLALLRPVLATGKVRGFDVAEVSPRFDQDARTAKLAAIVIFALVNTLTGQPTLGRDV